ncbi:sulfatase [Dokdonella sp.]|uniref:sulfatase family protein n=1 Tax=Dokdonella sp. TaxID=2291710 RepID=UPI002F405BEC
MLIKALLACAFALAALWLLHARAADTGPDIVVLMADDLDEPTFDTALALDLLPAIEAAMVDGGLRFDESFVTDSLCCPSRATFMTGQYPHNHGVRRGQFGPDGSFGAFDDSRSIATALEAAGYRTGLVGKFLNGYGYTTPRNHPDCTSAECRMRYVPAGWSDWQGLPDYGELNGSPGYAGAYCMYNYTVNDRGALVTYGSADADYQTDVIAQRAGAFIDAVAATSAPLFLVASPLAPHYELCLPAAHPSAWDVRPAPRHAGSLPPYVNLDVSKPSFDEADVGDKPAWFAQEYASLDTTQVSTLNRQFRHRLEALRAVDALFATVRARLVAAGRWDDAYVIFTSDNGWLYGEHRVVGKVLAYEESIRVPLLLRGPGVATGAHRAALVLNNDLAPTLAALAGVVLPTVADGRSLEPLFAQDHPPAWRRRFLVEHFRDAAPSPVSWLDFLGVRTASGDDEDTGMQLFVDWRNDWLVDPTAAGSEHYDLVADPLQLQSVDPRNGAREAQRAALQADLALLRDCGQPDHVACIDAERMREHVFFGGFDGP